MRPQHGLWIVADVTYEKLIYDGESHNLVRVLLDRAARSDRHLQLGVQGLRHDRLALRLGDRAGQSDLAFNALQGHATSNISSITQKAAIAALAGPQDERRP